MKEEDIRKREVFNRYLELSAKDVENYFKDTKQFVKINCPACKSNNIEHAFHKNKFTYETCLNCDTLFVNPRPPISMLDGFYSNSPSTSFWVNDFFKPVAEARREKIFRPRAEYIADYLKNQEVLTVGDIGAGFGLFLEELKKIKPSFNVIAIEPSTEMAEINKKKKINVLNSFVEEVKDHDNHFDVLTAYELFEHLYNPEHFVQQVKKLLKNNGLFVLTTLNGLGFDIQHLWENSKSVSPPHHLNFFNPNSMKVLLENNGFEIIDISTPGQLDWDIIEGGWTNEKVDPGRFCKTISKYGSKEAKESLQNWINQYNFSSHMRIISKSI